MPIPDHTSYPLTMATENTLVRIVAIRGGATLTRRLTEMGLNIGSEISVRQQSGGGLVISRGETRFALGGGMAHKVIVCPV
jgi:ferrous iron transport protein A